jgi:hypothetical protein
MPKDRSRLPPLPQGERLEDRYGSIAIPALAAALGFRQRPPEQASGSDAKQRMSRAQMALRKRFEPQS